VISINAVFIILMSEKDISVIETGWQDYRDIIRLIRTQVFIIEQQVPEELEWDGLDEEAMHVVAGNRHGIFTGTARLLSTGQIGRMAVLKQYRHRGVGTAMLIKLLQVAARENITPLFLNAQLHAIRFYEKHGFIADGGIFDDAGIPHRRMIHIAH
jgi:predicted GNAT family N-acyltransferase